MKLYHQGDLLIREVGSLPKNIVKKSVPVVAYGEVTGHSHRFDEKKAHVYEYEGRTFVEVLEPAVLMHEEHKGSWVLSVDMGYIRQHPDFVIEKGIYEIENEREFDYAEDSLKKVVD